MNDLRALLGEAERAARAAGALLRRRPTRVDHKGAIDLVTEVDLASEALIRETLAPLGIPVQGEEQGGVASGVRWVVDPLDGTTNFVHDYPFYCVSIGLMDGEAPKLGCIYDPVRDHAYTAAVGLGAHRDGERLRVSAVRDVGAALAVTGFPYDRREAAAFYLAYVERVLRATQGIRRSGSAAMDLCTLAAGGVEVFWEFGLNPWDTCAGAVLVTEAGGCLSRLDGQPWHPGVREILATNGWVHDAIRAVLAAPTV